ncbi:MAG TPA: radical SAM family heme chaperone HemW [Rectinemataceae bacterium]
MSLVSILEAAAAGGASPRALYIHVPFCLSRCSYCDFHSFGLGADRLGAMAGKDGEYVDMLLRRLESVSSMLAGNLDTIYIGGGTPTALLDKDFSRLLRGIADRFGASGLEWTIEANPESLSQAKIEAARKAGVTRLSIGIQSMDREELLALGRLATPESNSKALGMAATSGLDLSVDLMSAIPSLPGRTAGRRRALVGGIGAALDAGAKHISLYDLVVEKGTGMERALASGRLEPADPDEAYEERKEAEAYLARRGFRRYEVSNFALPGSECRHNRVYWRMGSYLGMGSGAVSTLSSPSTPQARRLEENRDLGSWIRDPDDGLMITEISPSESAFECLMMGLRTALGVDRRVFERRFGSDPALLISKTVQKHSRCFIADENFLRLDDRGLDILNLILVDALSELEDSILPMRETQPRKSAEAKW